ncbi:hypothetical protein MP228_004822 [Amoeboaphelidium protococcarum]|nr:hypothetical protein MP228_004822 [Amoeboaphelidium protococcarum]
MDAQLQHLANQSQLDISSKEFAQYLDEKDQLKEYRQQFSIPLASNVQGKPHDPDASVDQNTRSTSPNRLAVNGNLNKDSECIYLCGNSLGLQPKQTRRLLNEELDVWDEMGVHGHFNHRHQRPWVSIDDHVTSAMAKVVGCKDSEVAVANSLTVNLHLLMVSFYRPTATRYKILIEDHAFPSDQYAVQSQIKFHGYDPADALLTVKPRNEDDGIIHHEDIVKCIEEQGESIALILFSGVQYYTGQLFNMKDITRAGHAKGCMVGFDLAHAVGNVHLHLHDWDVDFAAWCSYKYLNSGPGGIAGLYVNERHLGVNNSQNVPKLYGWWSNKSESRFQMKSQIDPLETAQVYRMSNPCVLAVVALYSSLLIFDQVGMDALRHKSLMLTGYLEMLLEHEFLQSPQQQHGSNATFQIVTPRDVEQRGCQLSLIFKKDIKLIFDKLTSYGVVCDERKPYCIRVAPVPLYNSFSDVYQFIQLLKRAIQETSQ